MKQIEVVAAIICKEDKIFATQRGYGDFTILRIGGNFLAEKWKQGRRQKRL